MFGIKAEAKAEFWSTSRIVVDGIVYVCLYKVYMSELYPEHQDSATSRPKKVVLQQMSKVCPYAVVYANFQYLCRLVTYTDCQ